MRIFKTLLFLLLVVEISGCGFKLRSQNNTNIKTQTIIIMAEDNFHPVILDLTRQLNRLGTEVLSNITSETSLDNKKSTLVLQLSKPKEQRKMLSVDDTGRSLEYEFSVEIEVEIQRLNSLLEIDSNDVSVLGEQSSTILARRVLVYDNNQLLAKSRERDKVREELYRVLVEQLLERLRAQSL